ncbi:Sec23-binding domain of Sec16-domain-containing protein [Lyophyllum atratum]|nr:Sec23-binding domain of Sec16-domain-containing protein [Lyophyllum atratum]
MNGVEAAASLFGSDEPASDPFATLGEDTAPRSSAEDLFNEGGVSSNSNSLFDPQGGDLFAAGDSTAQDTSQFYTQPESTSGYSTAGTYTHSGADSTSQQGWYDQQGQWQNFEQQQSAEPSFTSPSPETYTPQQQQHKATTNVYGSYAVQNAYTPPVNAVAQLQSPYDPYTPPQPTSTYFPSQPAAPATSTYTPYAYTPSTGQQGPTSQYTPSYAGGSQTSYTAAPTEHVALPTPSSSISVPPPVPVAAATITRPKVSNAYDPPFPTTAKANRRIARTGSGQQIYGYNAYETMSPPVGAYAHPSQTSPYVSHTPPPPQGTPPQRLAPPPPPPTESRIPSQSITSASSGGYEARNVPAYHVPRNRAFEESSTQSKRQDVTSWTPHEARPVLASTGVSETPFDNYASSQYTDPETVHPDLAKESSSHYNPYSIPSQGVDETPPPQKVSFAPSLGSPLSLASSLRASSPHQYALPPSPTSSQQYGRSSPFLDSAIVTAKRSASPRSFMEPPREKTPDIDAHAPLKDTTQAAAVRSPQQMLSSPLRSSSPASVHGNGVWTPPVGVANPYLPKSVAGSQGNASTANLPNGQPGIAPDPYAPKSHTNGYNGERTASPSSFVARSATGGVPAPKNYPLTNPYAPPKADILRNRSMSNSSMLSSTSTSPEDPYAPSQHNTITRMAKRLSHPSLQPEYPVQELPVKPFQTPYAPSPSLLGANDPLGRTSARVPVFSFGFGGKLITCFHGAESLSTGFDVALSSRNSTGVHIRVLKTLIPESALDTSTAAFPGPLFGDPGTSTTSLVRTGATTQTKTKKAKVTKYLSERIDELALGLRYLKPDSLESSRAEGKLVLIKLLQLMVEHDGRLTGTSELDTAVRLALVPRLEGTFGANNGFTAVADTQGSAPASAYSALPGFSSDSHESAISVTTLRPSTLDKIQGFLLRGERRQAYHYALDEKLWAHAMVIASSIDKEAWKEVVGEFLRTELGTATAPQNPIDQSLPPSNGRESLRAAYSLFSGQGAAAVQELVPQTLLVRTNGRLQPQVASHPTPRTPNFTSTPTQLANVPLESLSKWAETVAMMLSSPLSQETSAALTALGDHLAANQLFEAAHVCYLLAPLTSPLGGVGHPSARIVLVGSRNPQNWPSFARDQDPLIFSETVEFALSLVTPVKGQDAFSGIAHLQAYRFIRAMALAEIGDIQQANRYCEAITATVVRGSPYSTPALLEQLKGLSDRIAGVTQVDKSFWTGAKLSKPSLDTIGGWLEGRFTKLVTGDADMEKTPEEDIIKPDNHGFSGPFSHYSTISSTTPSARSSPQPTVVNLNVLPPARSGSAMASSSPYAHPQIDRASSAMEYDPVSSLRMPPTTSFASAPSFGQALNGQHNGYSPTDDLVTPRPSLTADESESTAQDATWWGGTAYAEGPATQTPTASSFLRVEENALQASTSSGRLCFPYGHRILLDEEDEDLGFGNSKREMREKASVVSEQTKSSPSPEAVKPLAPPEPEATPAPATSGWLSRWWKKSDAMPGPVKASLGDESAFYYDKDLKRWVNKKAGAAESAKAATPPPPPSRAQTASPAMSGPRLPAASESPPPNRSASAIDLSTSPPSRTTMRVRSNLVPTLDSAPSTPTGTRLAPPGPPPGRPKSQASKRNIRSRYVDVFQQEGGA